MSSPTIEIFHMNIIIISVTEHIAGHTPLPSRATMLGLVLTVHLAGGVTNLSVQLILYRVIIENNVNP